MERRKPTWSTASVLVYAGGLTVLGAAVGAVGYLAPSNGKAALAGWSLLILAVLYVIAHAFRRRDRWIAAGIFAFASVVAWAVFVGALWIWFGWLDNAGEGETPFSGFSVARLSLELLILAAVFDDLRRFRFPFIAAIGVLVGWVFVTDLVSNGGNWSAVVTLAVGFAYLVVGSSSDRATAFWFHLGAGLLIGGSLLYWWHDEDWQWGLISVAALAYVRLARHTGRSSWAVLGAIGLLSAASHYSESWGSSTSAYESTDEGAPFYIHTTDLVFRGWVPLLVFAFTGFLLVSLGLAARRRSVA
jgi:hypothetical protein